MKYASDAPKVVSHEAALDTADVKAAILAWLATQDETRDKVQGVAAAELDIAGEINHLDSEVNLSVVWQTPILPVQAPRPTTNPMAKAGEALAAQVQQASDGGHRQGRFAVVHDQGDRANTGTIAERFDTYDEADTYRFESPTISNRASIIWVTKSGSRYEPDQRTPAADDATD